MIHRQMPRGLGLSVLACAALLIGCDSGPEPPLTVEIDGPVFSIAEWNDRYAIEGCTITLTARASGEGESRATWTETKVTKIHEGKTLHEGTEPGFWGKEGLYAGEEFDLELMFGSTRFPLVIGIEATYDYEGETRTAKHSFRCIRLEDGQ